MANTVTFALDGFGDGYSCVVKIEDLEAFPDSVPTMIVKNSTQMKNAKNSKGEFKIQIDPPVALNNMAYFYQNKIWPNPMLFGKGFGIESFYKVCDYLNLPDNFEEVEENEEENEEQNEESNEEPILIDDYRDGDFYDEYDDDDGYDSPDDMHIYYGMNPHPCEPEPYEYSRR